MTNDASKEETNKILFANLIMMLSSSAMQQLGKIVSPLTGKTEVDLNGAQMTIDIISMLQAKTKGNCDENETKMIADILSSLQLNYVETSQDEAAKGDEKSDESDDKNEESDE